jgi:hypothetical protein
LATAVRPIHLPEGWLDRSPVRERFRRFVHKAVEEAKNIKEVDRGKWLA